MSRMRLKDIAIEKNERVDNPSQSQYSIFVGLEHYDSGEASIRRHGSTERLESTMKVFHSGDILIARRNVYLKRAATVDFDGLTSGDSIVLHIENEAYRRIAPFVLNTDDFWIYANQHADGSMSKRLSPKLLMEYEFSLPDGNLEQVADILWAMERVKIAYRELIARTDDLVKSQFIEMFGDPVENPMNWETQSLLSLGVCKNGMNFHSSDSGVEVNCLGVGDFKDYDVISATEELPTVSLNEIPSADYLLKDEDIVFVRSNGNKAMVGRSVMVYPRKNPTTFSGFCIRFRNTTSQVIAPFLLRVLKTDSMRKMMYGRGANIQNLNQQTLASLNIPIPPIGMQKHFVSFVEQSDKSKFAAKQALDNLNASQKALMNQIFGE